MQAVNEGIALVAVAIVAIYVVPFLLGTVKQVFVNVASVLLVCYILALFYTGTVTLTDLHSVVGKAGPVVRSIAGHLQDSVQIVTTAIKVAAASSDDSWSTRLCKLLVNGF